MNRKKIVVIISILVIVFSVVCSLLPLITKNELADKTVISTFGETVTLYGKGLYARNSVSSAVQAIAQDMVTLILIVPGMITSLLMIRKERMIGKFLLTGLFGYMLYTYMSYAFLMYYNDIFLLYVANMTLSFYGFVLCVMMLLDEIKVDVASFVIFGPICIASYIFFFIIMRKIGRYNTVKMRDDYDY